MFDFTGKKVLVTGSSQGIGEAIALEFARHNAITYVHASSSLEKAQKACEKIKAECPNADVRPVVADFLDKDIAEVLYKQTGDVDILVQNVAVQYRVAWEEITDEQFEKQITANLHSNLKLFKKYVPYMKQQKWGRIIVTGSIQQYHPHPLMAVYAASKEGQMSFVRNLGKQLAPYGITVNCMSPGIIVTPRNYEALQEPNYRKACLDSIPNGYFGEPKDCTGAVLLFASEEGRFITGENIICDGGNHLI